MNIELTSDKCEKYIWFAKQCLDLRSHGNKAIQSGVDLVICKHTPEKATLLVFSGELLLAPRTARIGKIAYSANNGEAFSVAGVIDGGIGSDKKHDSTPMAFPMQDFDGLTWLANIEDVTIEHSSSENYGNSCWISEDMTTVLSWKSPPSGFSIANKYEITGLTRVERTTETMSYYTCFDVYIYEGGDRLCHGPQDDKEDEMKTLVVGACYKTDTDGKVWLVCIAVSFVEGYKLKVFRSDDSGAKWEEIFVEGGHSRARTTAHISTDASTFVFEDSLYSIDDKVESCSLTSSVSVPSSGRKTVTGKGGYGSSYAFTDTKSFWTGMSAEEILTTSQVNLTASFTNLLSGSPTSETFVSVPLYMGSPATEVGILRDKNMSEVDCFGNAAPEGQSYAVFYPSIGSGGYCEIKWDHVDCQSKDGLVAMKLMDKCNSSFEVKVTLLPQNVTATYTREEALTWVCNPSCGWEDIIVVSGPSVSGDLDHPYVSMGQYTAIGAHGNVTWSVSCGTISETGFAHFTGCGCPTAISTVTATDECGRSGRTNVMTAEYGMWVSNNNKCCVVYVDSVPKELWPAVQCDTYQCHGACKATIGLPVDGAEGYPDITKECWQAMPGWGYDYATYCNNCGPRTTTVYESFHWECP